MPSSVPTKKAPLADKTNEEESLAPNSEEEDETVSTLEQSPFDEFMARLKAETKRQKSRSYQFIRGVEHMVVEVDEDEDYSITDETDEHTEFLTAEQVGQLRVVILPRERKNYVELMEGLSWRMTMAGVAHPIPLMSSRPTENSRKCTPRRSALLTS